MGGFGGRSPGRGQREEMEGESGRILFQLKTCLKIRKEKLQFSLVIGKVSFLPSLTRHDHEIYLGQQDSIISDISTYFIIT